MKDYDERLNSILDFEVLLQAVEQSPSTIVITDTYGNIEYVNPKFTELTGYTVEEAIGINPRILKSGEHPKSMYKELWKTIWSGKVWSGIFHNKKKDGELYWESARIAPVKNKEDKITHFIAIKEDITIMKKMEEENQRAKEEAEIANKAKSQFLANMSHEIRTPLNGIKGMIDLTLLTELTEEQKENLLIAQDCVGTLMKVINNILDFSKIEAGKTIIEYDKINFRRFIEKVIKTHDVKAKEKGIDLLYNISPDIPEQLVGDSMKIKQILNNLLSNSIKFTEKGKVQLTIEKEDSCDEENIKLKFKVEDTGIGIDEEGISRLFQSFSQVDGSITRKYGGTGLGLAISKSLANMMNGDIWVESEKGKGSTFYATLKLKLSRPEEEVLESKKEEISVPNNKYKILIVDDDKINQRITTDMLRGKGHEVQIANNGVEALKILKKNKFDLIFMDIQMEKMDGVETTKLIRKCEEERGTYTPIIALTAYAIKGDREKFLYAGMDDYISKPFNMDSLLKAIEKSQNKLNKRVYESKIHVKEYSNEEIKALIKKIEDLNKAIKIKNYKQIESISKVIKDEDEDISNPIRKAAFKIQMASRKKDIKTIEALFEEIYLIVKNIKEREVIF